MTSSNTRCRNLEGYSNTRHYNVEECISTRLHNPEDYSNTRCHDVEELNLCKTGYVKMDLGRAVKKFPEMWYSTVIIGHMATLT